MSAAVETLPPPPSYSDPTIELDNDVDALDVSALASELPAYTPGSRVSATPRRVVARQTEPKEFSHELKNRNGKPFAVLTIIAEGAYSKQIPTFIEGMPVKGRVRLILEKPDTIQSVVVSVTGKVITGYVEEDDQVKFVNVPSTLWSLSDGKPQNTTSEVGSSSPAVSSPDFTGKLQGTYTWPFSIDIPKEVILPSGPQKEPKVFNPPETFNERYARVSVCYGVSVRFTRGKLRPNHKIQATIGYMPMTRPPPLLDLRRLAYQQGTPLLGPTIDPEGWSATESVQVQGNLNNRTVQVGCTLFLAKPLSYTRGSLIPFCLRLESGDEQALDMLSTPKAIILRLNRRVSYVWNMEGKSFKASASKDTIDQSQLAVWWQSTEGSEAPGRTRIRFVNGELHLRPDVKPSCAMAHFRIEYSLVLFPFESPDFTSTGTAPLINHPIDIVSSYAPGPRPMKFAPPGYEPDTGIVAAQNPSTLVNLGFI
ncbi:hypothetical protein GALMADRAFT_137911 [Galerina marginata CBS 339.88]|uniref:Arrestin-like N-terminal domain-containing protein n=1 Tax=Galerina marginata (strain CBS 339.88) TaxID=685588 RepID=A0A067T720_GALM3|nr:hypothetical protein GALMADRAFT_137911 [Galerina marginata CBS 339.88]